MAAYAALLSLTNLIEQIQCHPRPPITLDKDQSQSLTERVAFFQEFLEVHNSHYANQEMERLRDSIADAAYAAEDVESNVVDQIQAQSRARARGKISFIDLYQGLQKVVQDMDFLKKEVMEIKNHMGTQDQWKRFTSPPAVSSPSPLMKEWAMVGHDDPLHEILDKLTGQPSGRQIISISGMGGIGKTTLARNVYKNQLIVERFDICSWVTISQEYNIREILLEVLCQARQGSRESLSAMTDEKLRGTLYKSLYGRRYLIVMDDVWSDEAWDKVKFLFPDNCNGSRILVTTRLSKLAQDLSGSDGIKVDFLDEDTSWNLLCKTVFVEEPCPPELMDIGMMIARNCKGLPLSIVVIGGLLSKFKQDREYWEYIAQNLNLNVNLEENELCFRILYTSYEQLPVHLKPCFLYMGIFPEDTKIRVSELIKLWAAEGFLKPMSDKSWEESADEYLKDLTDRNLIMVSERGSSGKLKYCNIHDLLRELCLRQAQKEKFLYLASEICLKTSPEGINTKRRIVIPQSTSMEKSLGSLESELVTRSLVCYSEKDSPLVEKFRLLRVLKKRHERDNVRSSRYSLEDLFVLVNLRYLGIHTNSLSSLNPSSVSLWNLQTLIIHSFCNHRVVPSEIWRMHRLRHVKFGFPHDLEPPKFSQTDGQDDIVLENLQTLVGINNFKCSEEMVKRIPNVKKLVISYSHNKPLRVSDCCPNNLVLLHKLEALRCQFNTNRGLCSSDLLHNMSFPNSLKKLTLRGTCLSWEFINTKIGSLPLLEVLKLRYSFFIGPECETIEGQFPNLKYLLIEVCTPFKCWTADSNQFPRLKHLVLKGLHRLEEIPSGLGEIPTLESIHLEDSSDSAIVSAKQILDEQEDFGNDGFRVEVLLNRSNDQHLESLASHNFQVIKTYK